MSHSKQSFLASIRVHISMFLLLYSLCKKHSGKTGNRNKYSDVKTLQLFCALPPLYPVIKASPLSVLRNIQQPVYKKKNQTSTFPSLHCPPQPTEEIPSLQRSSWLCASALMWWQLPEVKERTEELQSRNVKRNRNGMKRARGWNIFCVELHSLLSKCSGWTETRFGHHWGLGNHFGGLLRQISELNNVRYFFFYIHRYPLMLLIVITDNYNTLHIYGCVHHNACMFKLFTLWGLWSQRGFLAAPHWTERRTVGNRDASSPGSYWDLWGSSPEARWTFLASPASCRWLSRPTHACPDTDRWEQCLTNYSLWVKYFQYTFNNIGYFIVNNNVHVVRCWWRFSVNNSNIPVSW